MRRYLIGSLGLHIGLGLLFLGGLAWLHQVVPKPKTPAGEVVEIELTEGEGPHPSRSGSENPRAAKNMGLQKFSNAYQFQPLPLDNSGDSFARNSKKDEPLSAWGSGGGTFERIRDQRIYQFVHDQVSNILYYPGILAKNRIQGTINARLVLNMGGNCDWQRTQISGTEPYLRVFVLDVLKQTCQQNFKHYLSDRELTNLDLSFRFAITENDDQQIKDSQNVIVGNVLLFYRSSQRSLAQWDLGPFHGMFPIPAIYLDFDWLKDNWDQLINNKNPLKEFRKTFGEG